MQLHVLEKLKELGADIDARDEDGFAPIHLAAWEGNPEVIEKLHALGADLEVTDAEGATAMHAAANYGKLNAVMKLHELGASFESKTRGGTTPMELAARGEHTDIAVFYLQQNPMEMEKVMAHMKKTQSKGKLKGLAKEEV